MKNNQAIVMALLAIMWAIMVLATPEGQRWAVPIGPVLFSFLAIWCLYRKGD